MFRKGKSLGLVDDWLNTLGFYRKNVANDETCLFRAISEQQYGCQVHHERVRKECIAYARDNYEEFSHLVDSEAAWQERMDRLENHMQICDNIELFIASEVYQRDVIIFNGNRQTVTNIVDKHSEQYFFLYSVGKDHYDVIYRTINIESAGFCQSIVYKILYENVFGIEDVEDTVYNMLYKKQNFLKIEKWDENLANVPGKLAPFPYKIAKALDPNIYRNIEFDAWGEIRKETRLGEWYHGDDKLTQGTKCIYNDEKNAKIECYIQEILRDQEKCVIFITSTAEKKLVDYKDLSPEDNAKPWPLPYRFSKNTRALPPIEKLCISDKKFKKKKNKGVGTIAPPGKAKALLGAPLHMQPSTSSAEASTCMNPFIWPTADMIESVFAKSAPTTPVISCTESLVSEPQNEILDATSPPSDTLTRPKLTVNITACNPPPMEVFSPINPLISTPTVYATTPMQEMPEVLYPTTPVLLTTFSPTQPQYMYPPTPPPAWLPYSGVSYPAFTFPPC